MTLLVFYDIIYIRKAVVKMASVICAQCKKRLDNDYIYYEKTAKKLCSMECMSLFLQSEKEKEDRYKLEKTICRVFNVSEISTRIRKDIKNLTEKEGLAYSQISAILHYIYDIEGKITYTDSLYYVPQYKDKARAFYNDLKEKAAQAERMKEETLEKRVVKPVVNSAKRRNTLFDPNKI